ncbi:hypothetical protein [Stigmatella aurantiaca]|uniref:hypothetical protein n=1 Tax=Stigmatella aurantiaca TaxID=41 RepID=UPI00116090BC|nr:hypothetical protein [Stigmatella aurantiaca]
MMLSDFLALPDEHTLSTDDAQALNEALSKAELKDIPSEKHSLVIDYLKVALLNGAVAPNIQDDLRRLLVKLKAAS